MRLARTIKEIRGACIPTIPAGTQFQVEITTNNRYDSIYSNCKGLPINSIWNDEFELVMGNDFSI